MKVIIDRFEGDFAVVEMDNKEFINMPKVLLPNLAAVGNIIEITTNGEETDKRNERIRNLSDQLWE